jgi:hypothetical protein
MWNPIYPREMISGVYFFLKLCYDAAMEDMYCSILTCPELYFDGDGVIFIMVLAVIATLLIGVHYFVKLFRKK